jgi:hypothetical protein
MKNPDSPLPVVPFLLPTTQLQVEPFLPSSRLQHLTRREPPPFPFSLASSIFIHVQCTWQSVIAMPVSPVDENCTSSPPYRRTLATKGKYEHEEKTDPPQYISSFERVVNLYT